MNITGDDLAVTNGRNALERRTNPTLRLHMVQYGVDPTVYDTLERYDTHATFSQGKA